jgi:dihydroflavonol-4-reductase
MLPALQKDPAWFSFVYVDDVVDGLVAVAERGRAGGVYVIGGEAESINGFAAGVTRAAGVFTSPLRLPASMLIPVARALDVVAKATGASFPLSVESVRLTSGYRWLSDESATRRELGYTPRPLRDGIPLMLAGMRGG